MKLFPLLKQESLLFNKISYAFAFYYACDTIKEQQKIGLFLSFMYHPDLQSCFRPVGTWRRGNIVSRSTQPHNDASNLMWRWALLILPVHTEYHSHARKHTRQTGAPSTKPIRSTVIDHCGRYPVLYWWGQSEMSIEEGNPKLIF